jgi:hypothetical protein
MKAAVVVTTIHDCTELLHGYLKNFAKYGHEVSFYVIPDRKTPAQLLWPKEVHGPTLQEQCEFLEKVHFDFDQIPFNSDNRRNVGYLMALADGAEMIVSIDDDNYCPEDEDFIGEHEQSLLHPGKTISIEEVWFNNLTLLGASILHPRGFPYYAKHPKIRGFRQGDTLPVRINAGLWAGDPDLDAITWLAHPVSPLRSWVEASAALAPDTWCPINSQNTAVHRDLMPAYYFIRMTSMMDRFGDIFQGYFALKVAKHMGWTVRFGAPVVTHRRNSHVYLKDVQKEIEPILLLEELLPKLLEVKLTGTTVEEAYLSLAEFVAEQNTPFYLETARLMREWSKVCRGIVHG